MVKKVKRKIKDGEYNHSLKKLKRKAFLEGQSWGVIIALLTAGFILGIVVSRTI